jgi:hypothetical protein
MIRYWCAMVQTDTIVERSVYPQGVDGAPHMSRINKTRSTVTFFLACSATSGGKRRTALVSVRHRLKRERQGSIDSDGMVPTSAG